MRLMYGAPPADEEALAKRLGPLPHAYSVMTDPKQKLALLEAKVREYLTTPKGPQHVAKLLKELKEMVK